MTDGLLLDTHTWLWQEAGVMVFSPEMKLQLGYARASGNLCVAAISLHEIAYAYSRGRLDLDGTLEQWFASAFRTSVTQVLPITTEIAIASAALPEDFHGDPGDRLLAATAMVHDLLLCTRDRALLRFGRSGLYRVLGI